MNIEKKEMLESMAEYMERIQKFLPQMIVNYRKNNIEEASLDMLDLIDGLIWLDEAITITIDVHNIDSNELGKHYREFVEAMEHQDYQLVGDLLEYELNPSIENMKAQLYARLSIKSN